MACVAKVGGYGEIRAVTGIPLLFRKAGPGFVMAHHIVIHSLNIRVCRVIVIP